MIEGRNIDNSLFIDSNGQAYLFWVKIDTCNAVWVCELEKDLQTPRPDTARPCISMSQEWEKIWPSVNEGPFVIRHKGTYYLTYSANSYECPDYGIGYATADHPWVLGPNRSTTRFCNPRGHCKAADTMPFSGTRDIDIVSSSTHTMPRDRSRHASCTSRG